MVKKRVFTLQVIVLLFTFLGTSSCNEGNNKKSIKKQRVEKKAEEPPLVFGFKLDDYVVHYDTVRSGWTFSHMLIPFGISQFDINRAANAAADSTIGLKYVVDDRPFMVLTKQGDTTKSPQHLVYETDAFSYVVFDFEKDSIKVRKESKPVSLKERTIAGKIHKNSNLTAELNKNFSNYSMTADLADRIEGIFAWSIDFFRLQPNDKFAAVYQEKVVDSVPYGVGQIDYMVFEHNGETKYAFRYITDSTTAQVGYYDEEAREMKRPFLMSPVKFARISSGYNLNRIHPIYKKRRAHLGTDYAAPTGTPIMATADGTVSHATRSGGNGIYVKIRHNKTYETQYLHMSKIASGIKKGVRVQQGQVIGYVGSTGAATGPHVCYRFWKNGKQINHRAEKFPKSEPMKKEMIPDYLKYIEPLKKKLDQNISSIKDTIEKEQESS
jgi:murein DD-endopeptidase MepM/ murein hydrolase activator NlpD